MVREQELSLLVSTQERVVARTRSIGTIAGARHHSPLPRTFWKAVLLALVVRLLVMWFSHPWDVTTFYNMFVNLAEGVSPYFELERLSHLFYTSTSHWVAFYEYFAYPPGLIYLYYLPAQLWEFIVGTQVNHWLLPATGFVIPPAEVLDPIFQLAFKAPIFAADVGIAAILARLSNVRISVAYLFNPLVILISAAFTFESLALLTVVAAYYFMIRDRPGVVGLCLAVGGILKVFPIVLFPLAVMWYLLRQQYRNLWRLSVTFVITTFVALLPMWEGFMATLRFHSMRTGGGLSIHQLVYLHDTLSDGPSLWLQAGLSPAVGAITLVTALSLAYLWVWRTNPSLLTAFIVVLAAFLLGSKLVNEQFTVWMIPLLLLGLASVGSRTRKVLYWSATLVPLVFALLHVPLTGFLYPLGHWGIVPFDVLAQPTQVMLATPLHASMLTALAFVYIGVLILIVRDYSRSERALVR